MNNLNEFTIFLSNNWFSILTITIAIISLFSARSSKKAAQRSARAAEEANEDNRQMNQQARRPWIKITYEFDEWRRSSYSFTAKNEGMNPIEDLDIKIYTFDKDFCVMEKMNSNITNSMSSGQSFDFVLNLSGKTENIFIYVAVNYKDAITDLIYSQSPSYYQWSPNEMLGPIIEKNTVEQIEAKIKSIQV